LGFAFARLALVVLLAFFALPAFLATGCAAVAIIFSACSLALAISFAAFCAMV